ncbi:pyridoxamine 5'-phosphate oxidase family protein [Cumulibacter manganitolerans]|uniref:pyridoxamine 5'-phosphate oxidase family protein n=1 Tax=Cumulibacter manganitolerans TaxID=1884992 RepID=UPI0012960699|nr:pyridoxamine 5'-phosphate oxidase family protein [Cumulibacter manganitolerans]
MVDDRLKVRSYPQRARYDLQFAAEVLDAGRIGHLALTRDGFPHLVPMMFVRVDRAVHVHCRAGTQLATDLAGGARVAFAVTIADGVVLANEVRFHSMNYRSLVVHGVAEEVTDEAAKRASFDALAEHVWPGRRGLSPATTEQLSTVALFAIPLVEFSGKQRTGPPLAGITPRPNVWTGHVDLHESPGAFHRAVDGADAPEPPWPF